MIEKYLGLKKIGCKEHMLMITHFPLSLDLYLTVVLIPTSND